VRAIAPRSLIVSLSLYSRVQTGTEVEIRCWAWEDGNATAVAIDRDEDRTWTAANVEASLDHERQRISLPRSRTRLDGFNARAMGRHDIQ
jgi:hypothetical protein